MHTGICLRHLLLAFALGERADSLYKVEDKNENIIESDYSDRGDVDDDL